MMFLYSGAMLAIRNPRTHGIIEDDTQTAIQVIYFLSFLTYELSKTKRVKRCVARPVAQADPNKNHRGRGSEAGEYH